VHVLGKEGRTVSKPVVYLTRRIPAEARALLDQAAEVRAWDREEPPVPRQTLLDAVADAEGLYCLLTDAVDEALLRAAPRLRAVSTMAVGYDNVDVAACTRRGIPVCNTPGVLTESTADLAFALLMATARRLPEAERLLRAGRWQTWSPLLLAGQDVHGKTIGIVGAGRIGQAVGARARGFGMKILYTARSPKPDFEAACQARRCATLDELLAASDFVSLHAPLTPETRHMIGEAELRRMKPTAILINTARGPLVDEVALERALREGWIWAAGLDVFEREPVPTGHALLQLPNLVALPHIGSASVATRTAMAVLAAENLLAVLAGRRPAHCVNPEVLNP
jgi:glyoxylate reductase